MNVEVAIPIDRSRLYWKYDSYHGIHTCRAEGVIPLTRPASAGREREARARVFFGALLHELEKFLRIARLMSKYRKVGYEHSLWNRCEYGIDLHGRFRCYCRSRWEFKTLSVG